MCKFGRHFRVNTDALTPSDDDYRRFGKRYVIQTQTSRELKRDGFFYYLLVTNIVLVLLVGILVIGAVKKVYFLKRNGLGKDG